MFDSTLPDINKIVGNCVQLFGVMQESIKYGSVESLKEAFAKFRIGAEEKPKKYEDYLVVFKNQGEVYLYLTVPDVTQAAKDIKETLSFYISFITSMLGIKQENVRLRFSAELGNLIKSPRPVIDALKNLIACARTSSGETNMRVHTYDSGFKSALPGNLVAMKILKRDSTFYRKMPAKLDKSGKKGKTPVVHLQKIRDVIDTELGFNQPGSDPYVRSLITQTFKQMTCETQHWFPPAFWAHAKKKNGDCKSTEALMAKMGYIKLIPQPNKIVRVFTKRFEVNGEGKPTKMVDLKKDELLTHNQEFRAGVKLVLPLLQSGKISLEKQVFKNEDYVSKIAITLYNEIAEKSDDLNKAYAFLSSYEGRKSKKTTVTHVHNMIGKAARAIDSKLPYKDGNDIEYENYQDIKKDYRTYLEKLFHRHKSTDKRSSKDLQDSQGDVEMGEGSKDPTTSGKPPHKKAKTWADAGGGGKKVLPSIPEGKEEETSSTDKKKD